MCLQNVASTDTPTDTLTAHGGQTYRRRRFRNPRFSQPNFQSEGAADKPAPTHTKQS